MEIKKMSELKTTTPANVADLIDDAVSAIVAAKKAYYQVAEIQRKRQGEAVTVVVSVRVDGHRTYTFEGANVARKRHPETGIVWGDQEVDWRYKLNLIAYECEGGGLAVAAGLPCIKPCRLWTRCAKVDHARSVGDLPCANTPYHKCNTSY
jgi:hypothetical protein